MGRILPLVEIGNSVPNRRRRKGRGRVEPIQQGELFITQVTAQMPPCARSVPIAQGALMKGEILWRMLGFRPAANGLFHIVLLTAVRTQFIPLRGADTT